MNFDVDVAIVIGFLVVTLIVGLVTSRNIKTIKEYAIGNRNFSTGTLAATITATWIGGGFFSLTISKTYSDGLNYIVLGICEVIAFLVLAILVAPRIKQFFGTLSVAESMGMLYGRNAQLITALVGMGRVIGTIAMQFTVCSTIFTYFFAINSLESTVISAAIVIFYSAFGGIKAVTFTDLIQILVFTIFIPVLSLAIWGTIKNPQIVVDTILNSPSLNFNNLLSLRGTELYSFLALIFLFIVPGLDPAIFQRIIVAKNIKQARQSLYLVTFAFLTIALLTFWIAILLLSKNSDLNPNNLIGHIIDNYTYTGLKGLLLVGVLAMLMSTADSYINSASILFAHDFCVPLNLKWAKNNELLVSRIFAVISGSFALIIALVAADLFHIILMMASFYMPIVTAPLLLAISGFRTTARAYLVGVVVGVLATVIFNFSDFAIDGAILAVISIILVVFSILLSHYLLAQPGGWVGVQDDGEFKKIKEDRYRSWKKYITNIKKFSLLAFCRNNMPKNEVTYSLLGLFCIISTYSAMFTIDVKVREQYKDIIEMIYHSVLLISTCFLTYPIWPPTFKSKNFISVFWLLGLFYTLSFVGVLQVIISNFGQFQLMIFLLSIVVLSVLVRWQLALILIITGVFAAIQTFKYYTGVEAIIDNFGTLQFKIMYALLLISSVLIMFLKPKQEYLEETEAKVVYLEKEVDYTRRELENVVQGLEFLEDQFKDKEGKLKAKEIYLKDQLKLRNIEIAKLKDLKDEFIRNLPHETNTPLTGILSLSDVLYSCYDSLDRKTLKQSIKDIVNSSDRLKTYINNIADLSKLSALTYDLKKEEVDLSEIVRERPVLYKKIFTDDAKQEFVFKVEDKLTVQCDEYYITQAIDNLISNAVKYVEGKPITISLTKTVNNKVKFTISDEGIGIPKDELISIFHKFTTSSKTRTPAGGRGIGLALCEKVITVHGGNIEAQSNGEKGAEFSFVMPL